MSFLKIPDTTLNNIIEMVKDVIKNSIDNKGILFGLYLFKATENKEIECLFLSNTDKELVKDLTKIYIDSENKKETELP